MLKKGKLILGGNINFPIPSLYGIFPYIYHKNQPFMER